MATSRLVDKNSMAFKGVDCESLRIGETYYYFVGKFKSRFEAATLLPKYKEQFPGAFIVEFDGNGNPKK